MGKTVTLKTGRSFSIEALKCSHVEEAQNVFLQAEQEKSPIRQEMLNRKASLMLCASATGKTIDELSEDLTETELIDMVPQVRAYNGLEPTGEAKAAVSTSPTSTAA